MIYMFMSYLHPNFLEALSVNIGLIRSMKRLLRINPEYYNTRQKSPFIPLSLAIYQRRTVFQL